MKMSNWLVPAVLAGIILAIQIVRADPEAR